ncbi:MAG: Ralstonia phage [Bacteroidota bacterium]
MSIFTEERLGKALYLTDANILTNWHNALLDSLPEDMIESPSRIAGFLAQTSHESGKYKFLVENLNYSDKGLLKTFPKYFNESNVMDYARKPEAIANRVYANRMGNGDEASGDGWRYCGRGLIQLTGKNNYQAFANSEQMNIEEVPDYLITYVGAVRSALWFWNKNNLNDTADAGDLVIMTKKINGGTHGLAERTAEYKRILEIYSA